MEKTYFIYRYVRLDTNVPFYIGLGTKNEVKKNGYPNYSHRSIYYRAYSKDRNYVCLGIMDKSDYEIDIMYETSDYVHAEEKEKEFISLYGLIYDNTGTLCNLTMGGVKFKTTPNYLDRSIAVRKQNGTFVGRNVKTLYMYTLNGEYIESFSKLKGFYEKYGYGDKDGNGISGAIRNKTSHNGYIFSFQYSEKLDVSEYKIATFKKYPVVQYDCDGKPVEIYKTMADVSKKIKVSASMAETYIKKNKLINGFLFKQANIHELPQIK